MACAIENLLVMTIPDTASRGWAFCRLGLALSKMMDQPHVPDRASLLRSRQPVRL
ncbi:MAG: hypothetical protein H8D45_30160 [Bacteroidetes bacterium]|nr:hypothetical protein [Bacteroidota bacterium]MBL7103972.1 hypothetical protein [Bacteroidales bacterium]